MDTYLVICEVKYAIVICSMGLTTSPAAREAGCGFGPQSYDELADEIVLRCENLSIN